MQCENCGVEMYIDHSGYMATGDTSAETKTEMFTVPYFMCHNERCPMQGQIVKGEAIALASTTAKGAEAKVVGGVYCCDEILCTVTDNTFKVAQRAAGSASLNLSKSILTVPCPNPACTKEPYTINVKGKTNLLNGEFI